MHEFAIASGIVKRVMEVAETRGLARIIEVRIAVGELTCLEPEQLRFCFAAITSDTSLRGCTLHIEPVAARVHCTTCSYRGAPKYWEDALAAAPFPTLECPNCGQTAQISEGRECMIRGLRCVSEAGAAPAGKARPS